VAIFGKEETQTRPAARPNAGETTLTMIAAGATVTGDISCTGVLKVEGRINGKVLSARQMMLAKDGVVDGDVSAQEVVVGGLIDGNVMASNRLELQPTAVVNGDITTKSIIVMEGARINGGVKMSELSPTGGQPGNHTPRSQVAVKQ
jgi:cytoskeletal protein CcmA (bactofilin family)